MSTIRPSEAAVSRKIWYMPWLKRIIRPGDWILLRKNSRHFPRIIWWIFSHCMQPRILTWFYFGKPLGPVMVVPERVTMLFLGCAYPPSLGYMFQPLQIQPLFHVLPIPFTWRPSENAYPLSLPWTGTSNPSKVPWRFYSQVQTSMHMTLISQGNFDVLLGFY